MRLQDIWVALSILFSLPSNGQNNPSSQIRFSEVSQKMGSRFEISFYHHDSVQAEKLFDIAWKEVDRIEDLISSWDPNSETSKINRNAGVQPVKVDPLLFQLIRRSTLVSKLTQGSFDISYAALDSIWPFPKGPANIPDSTTVRRILSRVGYSKIRLNQQDTTVFLSQKGMKIGFGAIGKGFVAERVKAILEYKGVRSGVVNAGGDLITWGTLPNGKPWNVGIADPNRKNGIISMLPTLNRAVVTSGNYERYVMINGTRYSHILDPRTGWPVRGVKSVTIIGMNAELCDALATAVFVLGPELGLDFINQLKGYDCLIVDSDDQVSLSENLSYELFGEKGDD